MAFVQIPRRPFISPVKKKTPKNINITFSKARLLRIKSIPCRSNPKVTKTLRKLLRYRYQGKASRAPLNSGAGTNNKLQEYSYLYTRMHAWLFACPGSLERGNKGRALGNVLRAMRTTETTSTTAFSRSGRLFRVYF